MRDDAMFALLETYEAFAALVALRGEGIAQYSVNSLPCGKHLRTLERYRHVSGLIQDFSYGHGDAEIPRFEAKRLHARHQLGLRDNFRAAAGEFLFDPLQDPHIPAAAAEHDCRQKAAHRAADYECAAFRRHRGFSGFLKLSLAGKVFYILPTIIGGTPWP